MMMVVVMRVLSKEIGNIHKDIVVRISRNLHKNNNIK